MLMREKPSLAADIDEMKVLFFLNGDLLKTLSPYLCFTPSVRDARV